MIKCLANKVYNQQNGLMTKCPNDRMSDGIMSNDSTLKKHQAAFGLPMNYSNKILQLG